MTSESHNSPVFRNVAPRFIVHNLEQALTFYQQLGFQVGYCDEDFAVLKRDEVSLHLNYFAVPPKGQWSVCWVAITGIETFYQHCQTALAVNAICEPLEDKPHGFKEFLVRDPSGNLLIFAEPLAETHNSSDQ